MHGRAYKMSDLSISVASPLLLVREIKKTSDCLIVSLIDTILSMTYDCQR